MYIYICGVCVCVVFFFVCWAGKGILISFNIISHMYYNIDTSFIIFALPLKCVPLDTFFFRKRASKYDKKKWILFWSTYVTYMRCFDTNLIVIVLHLMIYCYGSKIQQAIVKLSMLQFYINSIVTAGFSFMIKSATVFN